MLTSGQCPRCGTDDHTRRIDGVDDKYFGFCRACAYAVRRQPQGHQTDSRGCRADVLPMPPHDGCRKLHSAFERVVFFGLQRMQQMVT